MALDLDAIIEKSLKITTSLCVRYIQRFAGRANALFVSK